MKLYIDQIKKVIPHRSPFLFLDAIEEVIHQSDKVKPGAGLRELAGSEVKAHFEVKENLKILEGHFPGNPILPGVVQTEMMAQAACFTIYDIVDDVDTFKLEVALLNVTNAKYRKPVLPGMKLVIKTKCLRVRGPMMSYEAQIYNNDELMSESTFLASVRF